MRMQARRSAAFLLALVLVFSLSVCAMAAGTSLSMALAAPAKNQAPVQILVNAETAGALADGKLTVTYDAKVLQFVSAEPGDAWPEGSDLSFKANGTAEGKAIVAFASVYGADAGTAVVLNFNAIGEGSTQVALTETNSGAKADLTFDIACESDGFTDVKDGSWYHNGVDYVVSRGYMVGVSETGFMPNGDMSRGMMVTVLYRMAGCPENTEAANPFTDVKDNTWYTDAVIWAYSNEIASGTSATTFSPNGTLTRQQAVAFLYRYAASVGVDVDAKADLSKYSDAGKVSSWAVAPMSWAVAAGVINGTSATTLSPKANMTRAASAVMVMNFDRNVMG